MIKITPYSDSSVRHFYNGLVMKQKNGVPLEYEIRMDEEQITPRSKDLSNFFSFQEFMSNSTESIEFWIYKATSKRYDKYVFEITQKPLQKEADFQMRLEEAKKKMLMEWEFQSLTKELKDSKEKYKGLKDDNKELKERIKQLETEAKNSSIVQDLVGVLKQSSLLDKFTGSNTDNLTNEDASILNGIPDKELLEILSGIQEELGEETFQSFLGTALMLGKHPALIPDVKKLIEKTINKNN